MAEKSTGERLKEWWEDESLINKLFVQPLVSLATLPGQAWRGEIPLQIPEGGEEVLPAQETNWLGKALGIESLPEERLAGGPSMDVVARATEAGSTIPLSGLVSGAAGRTAANTLFSGAAPEDWIDDALKRHPAKTGLDDDTVLTAKHLQDLLNDPAFLDLPISAFTSQDEVGKTFNQWKLTYGKSGTTPTPYSVAESVFAKLKAASTSEADALAMTGNAELDKKILEAGKIGWKESYLMDLAKEGFLENPEEINWYLDPNNLHAFLVKDYHPDPTNPGSVLKYVKESALPKPSAPKSYKPNLKPPDLLDRYHSMFGPVREELYLRGLPQDPLIEVQKLVNEGNFEEAARLSNELKALLPENWSTRSYEQSTIVPHAFDTYRLPRKGETFQFPEVNVSEEQKALARDLGFNTEQLLYRGTRYPTDRFLDPSMKGDEPAAFLADRPEIAGNYGRYVYPLWTRAQDVAEADFRFRDYGSTGVGPWSSGDITSLINQAKERGKEMLVLQNLRDEDPRFPSGRSVQDQYTLWDMSLLRSPWAAFDPRRVKENNLLASELPLGPSLDQTYNWLIPSDEEERKIPRINLTYGEKRKYGY